MSNYTTSLKLFETINVESLLLFNICEQDKASIENINIDSFNRKYIFMKNILYTHNNRHS